MKSINKIVKGILNESDDNLCPRTIKGKIELSDGSETEFSIDLEYGWQQWGQQQSKLWATTELLTDLTVTFGEHGCYEDDGN